MAEITRPRTGELLRKLFEILMAAPNGLKAKDALAALTSKVQLTPYEAGDYPNGGGRRFDKIVRFATVDTTKAGWLVKAKGQWSITDAGRAAHKKFQDPEAFYKEAIRLYRQWKSNQPPDDDVPPSDDTTLRPGREVNVTYEVAEEQAWSEVESFLA
jgi:restriction system protein